MLEGPPSSRSAAKRGARAAQTLRQLRVDIDAAFHAQRGEFQALPSARRPPTAVVSTPRWAEVTALLASVGDSNRRNPALPSGRRSRLSRPSRAACTSESLEMVSYERQELLIKYFREWTRVTQAAGVVTRLHARSCRRRGHELLRTVLKGWTQYDVYQQQVRRAASLTTKRATRATLTVVYRKWRRAQQRVLQLRRIQAQIRERTLFAVLHAWRGLAVALTRRRKCEMVARHHLLRRYWRRLMAGIEVSRLRAEAFQRFTRRRMTRILECCVVQWGVHVELQKRWAFAVQWSRHRALGDAYDGWKETNERLRRVRLALQLMDRRRRRRRLQGVLRRWRDAVGHAQDRRKALMAVIHSQLRRQAFVHLKTNAQRIGEREHALSRWKMRRAVWTWLHRAQQRRMLHQRTAFLKESHDRLVLRRLAWKLWRRNYLLVIALRSFEDCQRSKLLRESWQALLAAIQLRIQRRRVVNHMWSARGSRRSHRAIAAWRLRLTLARERRELSARSERFHRLRLLRKSMTGWQAAKQGIQRSRALETAAIHHLTHKLVVHWARWMRRSKRKLTEKLLVAVKRRHRRLQQRCLDHWRLEMHSRHRALCCGVMRAWKDAVERQYRSRQLLKLSRVVHVRWRWWRWQLLLNRCRELRGKAEESRKRHELQVKRRCFLDVWQVKARDYRLGSRLLKNTMERHVLKCVLVLWRRRQLLLSAVRKATAFHNQKLRRWSLHRLHSLTIGQKVVAQRHTRRRCLLRVWASWVEYFSRKRRRSEADAYFRRNTKHKVVRSLFNAAANAVTRRHRRQEAEVWREAVVMQAAFKRWFVTVNQKTRCRYLGRRLTWRQLGRRAFGRWREAQSERQQTHEAQRFHSMVLTARAWTALLQVTKRRQVALAMWRHAMTRIRLHHALIHWKQHVARRNEVDTLALAMLRMHQRRTSTRFFLAWAQLAVTTRVMALRRMQRELHTWKRVCWTHWRLWRVARRWQRSQQRVLLHTVVTRGLRRHAAQQQAAREIRLRSSLNLLHRIVAHWRVEWWLRCSQKKLDTGVKRAALSNWMAFVAACRQKRRWIHYVQQLHRSETRSKSMALQHKRRKAGVFRDTRALQAQLQRSRVLMTHILHAWFLVAHSPKHRQQHRRQKDECFSKKRRRSIEPGARKTSTEVINRRIALASWARRVVQRCFMAWKETRKGKAAELVA